jgi:hypothetical protein
MDGTAVPVVKKETVGRPGKTEGQPAHTREVKLGCVFTQTQWDKKGHAIRDPDSTTYTGAIEGTERSSIGAPFFLSSAMASTRTRDVVVLIPRVCAPFVTAASCFAETRAMLALPTIAIDTIPRRKPTRFGRLRHPTPFAFAAERPSLLIFRTFCLSYAFQVCRRCVRPFHRFGCNFKR